MTHILGALAIAASAVVMGVVSAERLKLEITELMQLINMLEIVKCEITTKKSDMKSIIKLLGSGEAGVNKQFSESLKRKASEIGNVPFSLIWSQCVNESFDAISAAAKERVIFLGTSLGRYDLTNQISELERCKHALQHEYDEKYGIFSEKKRMYIGLYSSAGLIGAIVLL